MLLLALLLAQPAAETAAVQVDVPPLAISSVSPAAFPTVSATVVALEGSGFVLGVPTGWRLRCRLTSACPTNGHECTTFTHAGYGGGALYANATVLNDTHATCLAPAVFAPGPGLLSLCIDQGVWLCNAPSNGMKISYFTLVDAVLGRRPYFNESQGELLITAHSSLAGRALRLEASLGFAPNRRFSWTVTPTAAKLTAVLPFALAGLPTTINADLRLDVDYGAGNLTIWRRLIRAPLPADPAAAAAAVQVRLTALSPLPLISSYKPESPCAEQVDHSTMALRVGGEIFQGSGWFVGIPQWPPSHWLPCTHPPINTTVCTALWLATIRPRAALGTLTQIMPYGLQALHPPAQLAFLDACAILGVKVMYDMQPLGMTALGGMNYDTDWASATWKADVEANVSLVRNHPAILGYYICDVRSSSSSFSSSSNPARCAPCAFDTRLTRTAMIIAVYYACRTAVQLGRTSATFQSKRNFTTLSRVWRPPSSSSVRKAPFAAPFHYILHRKPNICQARLGTSGKVEKKTRFFPQAPSSAPMHGNGRMYPARRCIQTLCLKPP